MPDASAEPPTPADGSTERQDGAAQTLGLMPGEGEFTVPAVGQYEMLDRHLSHAAAGAAGYLTAGS